MAYEFQQSESYKKEQERIENYKHELILDEEGCYPETFFYDSTMKLKGYDYFKKQWEKVACWISINDIYVIRMFDNRYLLTTKQGLIQRYGRMYYVKNKISISNFLNDWLADENKRQYKRAFIESDIDPDALCVKGHDIYTNLITKKIVMNKDGLYIHTTRTIYRNSS
jgi:hypothetical protein